MNQRLSYGALIILSLALSYTCKKPDLLPAPGVHVIAPDQTSSDTITIYETYRDDVPPPPESGWPKLNPDSLSACELKVWLGLKGIYQIQEEPTDAYNIYAIVEKPVTVSDAHWAERSYYEVFTEAPRQPDGIFGNTRLRCWEELTADFFKRALGVPTCDKTSIYDGTRYLQYVITHTVRTGPCPFIPVGNTTYSGCSPVPGQFCPLVLSLNFDGQTGYLTSLQIGPP